VADHRYVNHPSQKREVALLVDGPRHDISRVEGRASEPSGQLQVAPLMAKEAGTAFVVPFQVPLNPMPDKVAPAAMLAL